MVSSEQNRELVLAPGGLLLPQGDDELNRLPGHLRHPSAHRRAGETHQPLEASFAKAGEPLIQSSGTYIKMPAGEAGVATCAEMVYPTYNAASSSLSLIGSRTASSRVSIDGEAWCGRY